MRNRILSVLLLLALGASAQENKTYTINSIKGVNEELTKDAYRYPEFRPGVVVFTDGGTSKARVNYHRVFDQVLFISPKGDTLALAHPENYSYVAVGTDTFYVEDKGFVERLTHYRGVNLARKDAIVFVRHDRKGAYGTYSPTIATEAKTTYSSDGSSVTRLQVDENVIYQAKSSFYLSDEYNHFFPATKKSFYALFRRQEDRLKEYLAHHEVNFSRQQDLLQLVEYMHAANQ